MRDVIYLEPQVKWDASDVTYYLSNLCINETSVNPLCAVLLALTRAHYVWLSPFPVWVPVILALSQTDKGLLQYLDFKDQPKETSIKTSFPTLLFLKTCIFMLSVIGCAYK